MHSFVGTAIIVDNSLSPFRCSNLFTAPISAIVRFRKMHGQVEAGENR